MGIPYNYNTHNAQRYKKIPGEGKSGSSIPPNNPSNPPEKLSEARRKPAGVRRKLYFQAGNTHF